MLPILELDLGLMMIDSFLMQLFFKLLAEPWLKLLILFSLLSL